MNKKGFAFIETIVTLTVLMIALVSIYTLFLNVLHQEKLSINYDRASDKYALFYIKEKMRGKEKFSVSKCGIQDVGSNLYGITDFVVYNCKNGRVQSCSNDVSVSNEFKKYMDMVTTCVNGADYVIFGEFKTNYTYSYAHIFYPNTEGGN